MLLAQAAAGGLGFFESETDIGTILHPGATKYDVAAKRYTITASGENMWFANDDFHFVWKKISGDVVLSADIAIATETGNPHRKGVLMIRQSLDADSAYADVALHADGLTSLQYRAEKGGRTHEVQASVSGPKRIRLEKRGDEIYMFLSADGREAVFSGASTRLAFREPFYIGIGACAHDKDAQVAVNFANVDLRSGMLEKRQAKTYSTVETIAVSSTDRRVAYVAPERLSAPNWSPDGNTIAFANEAGALYSVAAVGGAAHAIPARPEWYKGLVEGRSPSPDGQRLAFLAYEDSREDADFRPAVLQVMNLADSQVTPLAHFSGNRSSFGSPCWSADGKRIVFITYHVVLGE
jgi:hypothetical protein